MKAGLVTSMRKLPREVVVSSPRNGNVPCEYAGSAARARPRRTVATRFIRILPPEFFNQAGFLSAPNQPASPYLRFQIFLQPWIPNLGKGWDREIRSSGHRVIGGPIAAPMAAQAFLHSTNP